MAVGVEVLRGIGVLLGTQPPCIKLPEATSELVDNGEIVEEFTCSREAFTALNDLQVNGINKPIKSASNASKISVVRFRFLLFSILTS